MPDRAFTRTTPSKRVGFKAMYLEAPACTVTSVSEAASWRLKKVVPSTDAWNVISAATHAAGTKIPASVSLLSVTASDRFASSAMVATLIPCWEP